MNKAIIAGATSGIGYEVALLLIKKGWNIGVCGRRTDRLNELKQLCPNQVFKDEYKVSIRECKAEDIIEIDTFNELKALDKTYDV